jgi:hypothetical protein
VARGDYARARGVDRSPGWVTLRTRNLGDGLPGRLPKQARVALVSVNDRVQVPVPVTDHSNKTPNDRKTWRRLRFLTKARRSLGSSEDLQASVNGSWLIEIVRHEYLDRTSLRRSPTITQTNDPSTATPRTIRTAVDAVRMVGMGDGKSAMVHSPSGRLGMRGKRSSGDRATTARFGAPPRSCSPRRTQKPPEGSALS